MAGKCGGGCGPIVVRPDLTVEPGPDHEFQVLCDDQGAFLRRYTVDGGAVTTVDTELDGVTGYSPTGEVRTCTDGDSDDESLPEPECRNATTMLLCGAGDGGDGPSQPTDPETVDTDPVAPSAIFASPTCSTNRTPWTGDANTLWGGGAITFDPGPDTPQCGRHIAVAAQLVAQAASCDDTGEVSVAASVTVERTGPSAACAGAGGLWLVNMATGQLIDNGLVPTNTPVGWSGTLSVEAAVPAEDLAAGNIIAVVNLETGQANIGCGTRLGGWDLSEFTWEPTFSVTSCPGAQFFRTIITDCEGNTVEVVDTDLDGNPIDPVENAADCETTGGGGVVPPPCGDVEVIQLCDDVDGAPVPFLRHYRYSCAGAITSIRDTTIDGIDYEPEGEVGFCDRTGDESPGEQQLTGYPVVLCDEQGVTFVRTYVITDGGIVGFVDTDPAGGDYTPVGQVGVCGLTNPGDSPPECGDTTLLRMCDVQDDGSSVQFLRRVTAGCDGQTTAVADLELDGVTPYAVVGEVTTCMPEVNTCGLETGEVTSGESNSGQPGELQAVDMQPPPLRAYRGQPSGSRTHEPLPGGGQPLWDGGTLVFPADTEGAGGGQLPYINRVVAARLTAQRPSCDSGTAAVTVSVRATLDGPNQAQSIYYGGLRFYNTRSGEWFGYDPVAEERSTPQPGYDKTMTLSATVPAVDLANGNVVVWLALETYEEDGKQWTTDQFTASYAYNTDGCGDEAPSMAVRLCEPVTVRWETPPNGVAPTVDSNHVIVVERCDDTTGDGLPDTPYVELWQVDGRNPPRLIGSFHAGDLAEVYEPSNPVPCHSRGLCGGETSQINLPAVPPAPTGGTLPNGVNWTVNLGEWGDGAQGYRFVEGDVQIWQFDQPVTLRFGVRGLNVIDGTGAAECVVLPAGVTPESIHPNHVWEPATRRLCAGQDGTQFQRDTSIFRIDTPTAGLQIEAVAPPDGAAGFRGPSMVEVTSQHDSFAQLVKTCGPVETTPAWSTVVSTGIRRLTGADSVDVASQGVLQSVTVTVITGEATVDTSNGTATVPAGVPPLTWSVAMDRDEQLDVLTVTTPAGGDAVVTWTSSS